MLRMSLKTMVDFLLLATLKIIQFHHAVACCIIGCSCDVPDSAKKENSDILTQASVVSTLPDEDMDIIKQLDSLQEDLIVYKDIARDAEAAKLTAERTRDSIYNSWRFTTSQLESALIELRTVKSANAMHNEEKQLMQMELNKLKSEVKQQAHMHEMNMLLKENTAPNTSNWRQTMKDFNSGQKSAPVKSSNRLIRSSKKLKLALKAYNLNDDNLNSSMITPRKLSSPFSIVNDNVHI